MAELSIHRCTPRQVRAFTLDCLYAGLVTFIKGSPGIGKSAITHSIANELGLEMRDHRLSTSAPEDLSGLPRFDENGHAYFSPFRDLFPLEDTPLPKGKDGWLLFLDEFNSAPKSVQAAAYKLVLDKAVGQHKLHERVGIVMGGNLSTDRAITIELSTAMKSRVVHLEMITDHTEWLEDVAFKENYDPRVIAYLNYKQSALMDFKPDSQENTFCCPRTWAFVNRLLTNKPVLKDEDAPLIAGTITSGVAVDFIQFTKVFNSMVQISDILKDPDNVPVPRDAATRWATISHMMEKVDEKNFGDLATYADRFDMTFRILFYRSVMNRNSELRGHPAFAKSMVALSQYLNSPTQLAA